MFTCHHPRLQRESRVKEHPKAENNAIEEEKDGVRQRDLEYLAKVLNNSPANHNYGQSEQGQLIVVVVVAMRSGLQRSSNTVTSINAQAGRARA